MLMKLLKQYNVPKLGAFTESLFTAFPVLSLANTIAVIGVLYVMVHEYLSVLIPWLTLWIFVGFIGLLMTATMVLIYKFVLPSIWTFRNKQMNRFESDILQKIEELREEIRDGKKSKASKATSSK